MSRGWVQTLHLMAGPFHGAIGALLTQCCSDGCTLDVESVGTQGARTIISFPRDIGVRGDVRPLNAVAL